MSADVYAKENSLYCRNSGHLLKISPYGPDSLRVIGLLDGLLGAPEAAHALLPVEEIVAEIAVNETEALIRNGRLTACKVSGHTQCLVQRNDPFQNSR